MTRLSKRNVLFLSGTLGLNKHTVSQQEENDLWEEVGSTKPLQIHKVDDV